MNDKFHDQDQDQDVQALIDEAINELKADPNWLEDRQQRVFDSGVLRGIALAGLADDGLKDERRQALLQIADRLYDPTDECRVCGESMEPGVAMGNTFTGSGDFGKDDVVTVSPGGPGALVDCRKCSACGWSVTA